MTPRPRVDWRSIERELPLLISALILATVATFAWTAYVSTERLVISDAGARLTASAKTVGNLLVQVAAQDFERSRQLGGDTAVQRYLVSGGDPAHARRAIGGLMPTSGPSVSARVDIRKPTGEIALDTVKGGPPPDDWIRHALEAHPTKPAISPILAVGDSLYLAALSPITRDGRTIGFLTTSAYIVAAGAQPLKDLIGPHSVLLVGTSEPGGVWSDLARPQPAPPAFKVGTTTVYNSPTWGDGLGVALPIQGTPWILWVAQPRAAFLAPLQRLLVDMGALALLFIVIGIAGGIVVSRRISRPVVALTAAAERMASSEEPTATPLAVGSAPGNEVGRLVDAFGRMSARVIASRHAWEEQVEEAQALAEELEVTNDELEDSNKALRAALATEEKTRVAFEASERSLSTTLDSIGDAVIATDMAGCVVRMNPVAERLTGWREADAIGSPLPTVFHIIDELTRERAQNPVQLVLDHGTVVGSMKRTLLVARDGKELPIADSGAPIRDDTLKTSGVVIVFRDQTEERRVAQLQMNALRAEVESRRAQEASRLKSEFLANMSHELRTPLNAIIGFTEILHNKKVAPTSPEHDEYLGDVLTSARHLLQLINDILDLSKIEAGKLQFSPEGVDLPRLVAEVLGILRSGIAEKKIRVESHVDEELTDVVVDAARFKQVLFNYLSNALKFTPAGGSVTVRMLATGATFRLEVADTGIGIAPQDVPRLFTAFEQLDSGTRKRHAGTGLGLALVKRLVEAQGGTVGVTSTPGDGAMFFATLPRRQDTGH
jgi:PAS domain S-box-containing protein